jgi:type I restriction enzyme S subunit
LVPNEKVKPGFLYAFLASGIGYNLMQKGIYGTAIPHIEPDYAERVMVSLFPERQQKEIHDLIVTAANLRVEANELLNKAVSIFEKEIPNFESRKNYSSSFATRKKHNFRLDASFSAESLDKFYENLLDLGVRTKTIEELSGEVFTPNIFKRIRVNDPNYGIPFLSGSDLLKSKPKFDKFLSKRMENIDDYILKEGWIAIQDSGTIGYVSLISSWVDGCSATNNLVRIVPKSENFNYYIYPFLLSRPGQAILKCHEYGSVQKHIDNNQVKGIRVPILEEFQEEILEEIESMLKKQGVACDLEQRAINLVEKEIESWQ